MDYIFNSSGSEKTAYEAAKKFSRPVKGANLLPQTVQARKKNKDTLFAARDGAGGRNVEKHKRLGGGGRKCVLGEWLEGVLVGMITLERKEGHRVTGVLVQDWARDLARGNEIQFTPSQGWLRAFCARNFFSFRRITNLTTLTEEQVVKRAVSYFTYLHDQMKTASLDKVLLMDETAVHFEDPRQVTLNAKGARHVVLRSTGFASMRITVILAVTASGTKKKPLLIFKSKASNEMNLMNGCHVCHNEKAWVNQDMLVKWLDLMYPRVDMSAGKALVWDSCRAHIATSVKEHMNMRGIRNVVIPGGMTAYMQAGDLGIYKCFKDKMSAIIAGWKKSGDVERTKGGNPRPPKVETVTKWVMDAWKEVDENVILNSIKAAGFGRQEEWFLHKHDVYGPAFRKAWQNRDLVGEDTHQIAQSTAMDVMEDEDIIIDNLETITLDE